MEVRSGEKPPRAVTIPSVQREEEANPAVERAYRTLFVVGCPRSGTTWIQLLLAQHAAVATAPETQIFAYYLDQFRRQWKHEHEGPGKRHQGKAGLSRLLSEEEFRELCRHCAQEVLDKIARRHPDPQMVVEKSPRHALEAEWIASLFPEALFLHVVRDPRDTAASLLAAGRSWGGWAPRNPIDAARMWKAHVAGARRMATLGGRYREVRFESLRSDAAGELHRIFEWLGLRADRTECERAVEACRLERLREDADPDRLPLPGTRSPRGFFRRGEVGSWRAELSRGQVRVIERLCGDLMDTLGYSRSVRTPGWRAAVRIRLHDGIQRVRESLDWQLERLLWWV